VIFVTAIVRQFAVFLPFLAICLCGIRLLAQAPFDPLTCGHGFAAASSNEHSEGDQNYDKKLRHADTFARNNTAYTTKCTTRNSQGQVHRMEHEHPHHHTPDGSQQSLRRVSFSATVHCLTGCAIGEVLGMIIGTALGWGDAATIALAVILAFVFGYSLTLIPILRSGVALGSALPIALAADTISITVMEIIDNAIMMMVPGAMEAHVDNPLFWGSLAFALLIAGLVAWPVNYHLIRRGKGHAVVHEYHQ
jgi:hypothetical protein